MLYWRIEVHWMRPFLGILTAACFISVAAAGEPKQVPDNKLADYVTKRVKQVQPSRDERRIDEIGWAPSLTAAKLFAATEKRPVFLFTHDGKISTGRC